MLIYLFISDIETMVGALTSDKTGKNLPEEYARWRALNGGRAFTLAPLTILSPGVKISGYSIMDEREAETLDTAVDRRRQQPRQHRAAQYRQD
jgi:hypothetical protein